MNYEQIGQAFVQLVLAAAQASQTQAPAPAPAPQAPAPAPAPQADPFGGLGAPAPAPQPTVTADMISDLIRPLVANETTKAQLQAEMTAMGIAQLADTKPEQMAELYARFQRVAAAPAPAPQAPALV